MASGGKVFHGTGRYGDSLFRKPADPNTQRGKQLQCNGRANDGYADAKDEEMSDYKVATWASEQWQMVTEKPLLMTVGFFLIARCTCPNPGLRSSDYLVSDARQSQSVSMVKEDMPEFSRRLARTHAHKPLHQGLSDHEYIVEKQQWDATIRAYHA